MRPSAPVSQHSSRNQRQIVQDIAREKAITRYVQLVCGHYTTRQDIELYRTFQAKRDRFWCSSCGKWIDRYKPEKRVEEKSDIPLF